MDDDFADDGIIARTAAELLQVPPEDVQRLIDARVLDARRIGSRVYVRRAAVLALQAERRDLPPPVSAGPDPPAVCPPPRPS